MTRVTLEYCVPCGFRERALDAQETILTSLESEIDEFDLVMGDHGVFRIDVDGETVYDKDEDGEFDADEVVRELRERV